MENEVKSWWAVYENPYTGEEKRAIVHAKRAADAEYIARGNASVKAMGGREWWDLLRVEEVQP